MPTTAQASAAPTPSLKDRALDVARQAAHVSHEVKLLSSMASDAIEDGRYVARRAFKTVRRRVRDAADLDLVNDRIRRDPLRSATVALALGGVIGLALGLLLRRTRTARSAG